MRTLLSAGMLLCAAMASSHATDGIKAGGASLYLSSDSEDFSVRRASLQLLNEYQHLDAKTGIRYSTTEYIQNSWSSRGQQLSLVRHQMDPATWSGWIVDAGLLQHGGHDIMTLDASYRKAFSLQSGIEVFANRDVVETRNALDRGRTFNFAGISADAGLSPHWTVVGVLGYQSFNDGNDRRHVRGRIVYQPDLDLGLTLQLRYRSFESSHADVGRAYFNPEHYGETLMAAGWRTRINGWKTHLVAGAGRQQVNQDREAPTQLLEGSAEKQQTSFALRLRAGYSRSAAFGGPDYRWTYAVAELVIPF
jgi:hypothetical protein